MIFTRYFFSLLLVSSSIIYSSDAEEIRSSRSRTQRQAENVFVNPQFNYIAPGTKPTGIAMVAQSAQDGISAGIGQGIGIVVSHGIQTAIMRIWEFFVPDEQKELQRKVEYLKALGEIVNSAPNEEIRQQCILQYSVLAQKVLTDAKQRIDPYKTLHEQIEKKSKRIHISEPITIPFNPQAAQKKVSANNGL